MRGASLRGSCWRSRHLGYAISALELYGACCLLSTAAYLTFGWARGRGMAASQEPRTGAANFSTSGENAQENDLIVIRGAGPAAKFNAHFERMWNAAQPMDEFEPAIRALEPK